MGRIRNHLGFANVISVIALFVALGGGAWAVQTAQKNSVTSKSIRNKAIRSVDIGSRQVRASNISPSVLLDATTGQNARILGPCVQDTTSYQLCFEDQVSLEKPGRIYATADGSADSGGVSVPVGVNTCMLTADGTPFTGEFVIAANFSPGQAFSFAGVTPQLEAGGHLIRLECKGNGTLPGPRVFFPSLTTLELGAG